MTDPWEGIRHTLSVMPAQSLIPDPIMGFLVADGKKLLTDADALLAVKEAAEHIMQLWRQDPQDTLLGIPALGEAIRLLRNDLKGA